MVTDRIQQYLVQDIAGPAAAGHFSAGFRIAELWWMISPLAAVAILPRLARQHLHAEASYRRELQSYFDLSSAVTIAVAIVVTFAAPVMITLVFGARYASSSPVLILLVWAAPPIFSAFARTQHLTVKKTLLIELPNNLTTAVLSIGLSFALTPRYGATGAAAALLAGWWARIQLWSLTSLFRLPQLWREARALIQTMGSHHPREIS